MLSATTVGYLFTIFVLVVIASIVRGIYVEYSYRKEEKEDRKRHQDNVKAWEGLFGCNEAGVSDLESTRAISLAPRRTSEEIGDDYAFALRLRFLNTDERRILR